MKNSKRLKSFISWALRFTITFGLFYLIFTQIVDPRLILQELQGISIAWIFVGFLVKGLAILCSITRWDLLLKGQGIRMPFGYLSGTFLIGRFFGTFLPSTIGLDAYRAYDVARKTNETTKSVAVIVVEKITGFFALSTLVLVTIPFGINFFPRQILIFTSIFFILPVALSFILLFDPRIVMSLLRLPFPFKGKIEPKLVNAANAITIYHDQRGLLFRAVLLAIGSHFSTTLMYYATARAIDAPVTLLEILYAGPLMIVATVGLPSIGGEGVREFTFVGLLNRVGVPESSAFVLANLGFWIGLSWSLIGGVIYMARPSSYKPEITFFKPKGSSQAGELSNESLDTETVAGGSNLQLVEDGEQ